MCESQGILWYTYVFQDSVVLIHDFFELHLNRAKLFCIKKFFNGNKDVTCVQNNSHYFFLNFALHLYYLYYLYSHINKYLCI